MFNCLFYVHHWISRCLISHYWIINNNNNNGCDSMLPLNSCGKTILNFLYSAGQHYLYRYSVRYKVTQYQKKKLRTFFYFFFLASGDHVCWHLFRLLLRNCDKRAASLSPCMFLLVELFVGYLAERKISYDKSFFYIYDTSIILSLILIIYYKQTCTTSDLNYSICFANSSSCEFSFSVTKVTWTHR